MFNTQKGITLNQCTWTYILWLLVSVSWGVLLSSQTRECFVILPLIYLSLLRYCCWIYSPINQLSHFFCNFVFCVKYRPLWLRGTGGIGLVQELYQSITLPLMLLQFPMIAHQCHIQCLFQAVIFFLVYLFGVVCFCLYNVNLVQPSYSQLCFKAQGSLKTIKLNRMLKCNCYSLRACATVSSCHCAWTGKKSSTI